MVCQLEPAPPRWSALAPPSPGLCSPEAKEYGFIDAVIERSDSPAAISPIRLPQRRGSYQRRRVPVPHPTSSTDDASSSAAMQFVSCDVATSCLGLAASMGQFLLCSGTLGKRSALPHSRIVMHQPLGRFEGQAADIAIPWAFGERMFFWLGGLSLVLGVVGLASGRRHWRRTRSRGAGGGGGASHAGHHHLVCDGPVYPLPVPGVGRSLTSGLRSTRRVCPAASRDVRPYLSRSLRGASTMASPTPAVSARGWCRPCHAAKQETVASGRWVHAPLHDLETRRRQCRCREECRPLLPRPSWLSGGPHTKGTCWEPPTACPTKRSAHGWR